MGGVRSCRVCHDHFASTEPVCPSCRKAMQHQKDVRDHHELRAFKKLWLPTTDTVRVTRAPRRKEMTTYA